MTIYERVNPCNINKNEYEKFLSNDRELAREYAFNLSIYSKNKAEVVLENINYELVKRKLDKSYQNEDEIIIELVCKYPAEMRIDKLLGDIFGISRSKIKSMHKKGLIFVEDHEKSLNVKIKNGMKIHVLKSIESEEVLEAIV